MQRLATLRDRFANAWKTSLQVRVIGSMFLVTSLVMGILGVAMTAVVTQRLVDAEESAAAVEIDRVREAVETHIDASSPTNSTQSRLNSARTTVADSRAQGGSREETPSSYEVVLVVDRPDGSRVVSPEGFEIPQELRRAVGDGTVAQQYAATPGQSGEGSGRLLIGTPTNSDLPGLQVYLAVSLHSAAQTLALMRGLIAAAAIIVIVLIVGIAWLLAQQVITPVRTVSRIAERLAAGHLRERMSVEGEDEMARLAMSFNSMAESLSRQIRQLKEYGDLQRQFTSDVSHELRSPLTTVRMAAELIAGHAEELDPVTRRASELMLRELDRFESLLVDLLEISRHDAGVAELAEAQLDLPQCVHDAVQQVQHLADEVGVTIRCEGPEELVKFRGDPRRIERILRNLLANAIDHSEGNDVELNWAATDDAVAVTVTDHGVGLKEGQAELIFNRFWRADPSRKRHSGGTGLGLAIAREDATVHGGLLDAAGNLGIGSQFRLVLPREPNQPFTTMPLDLVAPGDRPERSLADELDPVPETPRTREEQAR